MISGTLFLDNNKSLYFKKMFKSNLLTKITAFVFWSLIYVIYKKNVGFEITVLNFVEGGYHMWFLYMIIGLYIITPVLRKITESKKIMEYFLVMGFIFSFLIPFLSDIFRCFGSTYQVSQVIDMILKNVDFHLAIGYVFYYVLGFYLSKYEINIKVRKIIYVLGVIGYVSTIFLTDWYSNLMSFADAKFYSNFSVNVFFISLSLFVFAKYVLSKIVIGGKKLKFLINILNLTFGVYLVHVLILDIFNDYLNLNTLTFNPIVSIVVVTLCVTVVSFIVSMILNCIPILKKYVV